MTLKTPGQARKELQQTPPPQFNDSPWLKTTPTPTPEKLLEYTEAVREYFEEQINKLQREIWELKDELKELKQ